MPLRKQRKPKQPPEQLPLPTEQGAGQGHYTRPHEQFETEYIRKAKEHAVQSDNHDNVR